MKARSIRQPYAPFLGSMLLPNGQTVLEHVEKFKVLAIGGK